NAGGPYTVPEGGTLLLSGSATDPDGTVVSAVWDLDGDGVFGEAAGARGDETLLATTFSAAGLDNGPYTISLRGTDNAGATTPTTAPVQIRGVAPTAGLAGPADGVPLQSLDFTLQASDPSGADQEAGFHFTVNWGDNTTEEFDGPSGSTRAH